MGYKYWTQAEDAELVLMREPRYLPRKSPEL